MMEFAGTFRVFHNKAGRCGQFPAVFPDEFQCVAEVDATSLDDAFTRTHHRLTTDAGVEQAWPENAGVRVRVDPSTVRSTALGDVIQAGAAWYVVAPSGFVRLAEMDEHFQIRVPSLWGVE